MEHAKSLSVEYITDPDGLSTYLIVTMEPKYCCDYCVMKAMQAHLDKKLTQVSMIYDQSEIH